MYPVVIPQDEILPQFDMPLRQVNISLATIFVLASPGEICRTFPSHIIQTLNSGRQTITMPALLRLVVERIGEELSSLMNDYCKCRQKHLAYSELPAACLTEIVEN